MHVHVYIIIMILVSYYYAGPFAPIVAPVAASAAFAVCATSLTTAVVAEGVSWLTEDQKVINDEYMIQTFQRNFPHSITTYIILINSEQLLS